MQSSVLMPAQVLLLVLIPAASLGASTFQAPPPAASTCTESTVDPCKYTCKNAADVATATFDLSTVKSQALGVGYFTAKDTSRQDYYWGACGGIKAVTCGSSDEAADATAVPAAIQTWSNPQPPNFPSFQCATLGAYSTQTCHHAAPSSDSDAASSDLVCSFTGGADSRKVDLHFACGKHGAAMTLDAAQLTSISYKLTVTDLSLCATIPASAHGLSWGSIFLLCFSLSSLAYFGGGTYYNVKYRGAEKSVEAIPQVEYWRQLPGLVKDGLKFSWAHTKKGTAAAQAMLKEKMGSAQNPELKEGLTEAEE